MSLHGQLGKLPARHDPRSLQFAKYVPPSQSNLPKEIHWAQNVPLPWSAKGNHIWSDCVTTAFAIIIQVVTKNNGHYNNPPDDVVIQDWREITGYPANGPPPGPGTNMLDALHYWQTIGIGVNRHKITGCSTLNVFTRDDDQIRRALATLGPFPMGFNCPKSAFDQFDNDEPWTVVDGSPSVGGHCVPLLGYDDNWVWTVTWGKPKKMSYDFIATFWDEAYPITSNEWKPLGAFDAVSYAADLPGIRA